MWASRIQSLTNNARSLMTGTILKLFRNKGPNRLYCCQPFDDICCSCLNCPSPTLLRPCHEGWSFLFRFYDHQRDGFACRWSTVMNKFRVIYEQQTEVLPNPSLILVVRTLSNANVANPIITSPMLKYLLEDTDSVNSWIVFRSRANMEISIICMMYACIHIHTYIHTYIYIYTYCMYMYVHVCTCMYMYVHVCTCMYMYVHVCMYACMHVCMYACMHVCMYACMYSACMHVCICMHVCMYVCMYVCTWS